MGYKFNPFTGTLDNVGTGGGGGTPGGSTTQVQFNDGGVFGGDSGLTYNKTTNTLTVGVSSADPGTAIVKGDINLDDGGVFTTTLQTITPTANRTISLPDATGTVALVGGSSGQLLWNNAGANAGASTLTYDGSILTTSGRFINSYNSGSLAPAKTFTGTWATGAGTTNTKPHVLIETTGATSNNWSNSGTGLGVNAASGFAGNLLDLQVNGTRKAAVFSNGTIGLQSTYGFGIEDFGAALYPGVRVAGTYLYEFGDLFTAGSATGIGFGSTSSATGYANWADTVLRRDAADTLAQRRTTNAQTFRCYGTYTDANNYVRAALSSNSTAVTLAAETAGTGADNVPINLTAAGTGTVKVNSVAEVAVSSTVVGLPTAPAVGMLTRVTDATAPAVGSTVAGGGAAAALVWYNGTNWTVIGV